MASSNFVISSGDQHEPLVDKRDLAQHLKVSTRQIDRFMASGRVPYLKLGNLVRFRLSAVEKSLGRFEVKAVGR